PTLQLFNFPGDAVIGHCSPHSDRSCTGPPQASFTPVLKPHSCALAAHALACITHATMLAALALVAHTRARARYPHPPPSCSVPTALPLAARRPRARCPPPVTPPLAACRPCARCLLPSGFAACHPRARYPHRRARWMPPLRSLPAAPGVCCPLPAALALAARCPRARCLYPRATLTLIIRPPRLLSCPQYPILMCSMAAPCALDPHPTRARCLPPVHTLPAACTRCLPLLCSIPSLLRAVIPRLVLKLCALAYLSLSVEYSCTV
ncbi:hypothetical protein B0H14DRAFT_3640114, partial [Mycena olivaceomarginata]